MKEEDVDKRKLKRWGYRCSARRVFMMDSSVLSPVGGGRSEAGSRHGRLSSSRQVCINRQQGKLDVRSLSVTVGVKWVIGGMEYLFTNHRTGLAR